MNKELEMIRILLWNKKKKDGSLFKDEEHLLFELQNMCDWR